MPKSKSSSRKRGSFSRGHDTARRLADRPRFDLQAPDAKRRSVGPQGGKPPRFPGRTGGR